MPPDWSKGAAPSLADFERLAEAAYAALPQGFRALSLDLVIRVEDFPDDETLDEMKCDDEFDLLGLFRGRGLAQRGATVPTGALPNMVWLYRRPILEFWSSGENTLADVVTHVLVHEIGHHFGFSDDDMERDRERGRRQLSVGAARSIPVRSTAHHFSSFLPRRKPAAVTARIAIGYQVITKSGLSSVQFAA